MMILVKMQFRDMPEAQTGGQFVTQVMPGMFQRAQRFFLLLFVSADGHPHSGVAPVGADVGLDDLYCQQPRIVCFKTDNLG